MEPDPHDVALSVVNIADLAAMVELRDIAFFEVHAERSDAEISSDDAEIETPVNIDIQVQERHAETQIEVRCKLRAEDRQARYTVDAAARYEVAWPVQLSAELMREFVERVGVMAVYPYLREALQDLASKLRLDAPVLGLLRPGGVSLTQEQPE